VAVTLDQGPFGLTSSGSVAANAPFVSIEVCSPGSTTACQTIDHVTVDTGSVGVRILHDVLSSVVAPRPVMDQQTGRPLSECLLFADGWVWGSVVTVDLTLGGRTIPGVVVQVVGDPASGAAPSSCSSGNGAEESSVAAFGANGVLGVGYFLEDCGEACAQQTSSSGAAPFYACTAAGGDQGCTPVTVPTANQPSNPIAQLGSDGNGLQLRFPAVSSDSAVSLTGTLFFGIGTEGDNGLGSATLYAVDSATGTLSTTYAGTDFSNSVIDSGSTGYYFPDESIPTCSKSDPGRGFYCPPSPLAKNAVIAGANGPQAQVGFTVGNADDLFNSAPADSAVFPTLAGPLGGLQVPSGTFDWGMPFFFGRSVFVLFERRSAGSTTGPAVGF
jgi:hypothetical protein